VCSRSAAHYYRNYRTVNICEFQKQRAKDVMLLKAFAYETPHSTTSTSSTLLFDAFIKMYTMRWYVEQCQKESFTLLWCLLVLCRISPSNTSRMWSSRTKIKTFFASNNFHVYINPQPFNSFHPALWIFDQKELRNNRCRADSKSDYDRRHGGWVLFLRCRSLSKTWNGIGIWTIKTTTEDYYVRLSLSS
jgi:hypothetical protein